MTSAAESVGSTPAGLRVAANVVVLDPDDILYSCLFGISIGFIISDMSEGPTENMPDGRSFEERVLARLDAIDGRLDSIDGGLGSLENQAERRALETRPIWERALAEILEVKEHVSALEQSSNQMVRKIDVLGKDMLTMRADQTDFEYRLDKLESKPIS